MNWMDKLERKYGRYAIPNITRVFVIINIIGWILNISGSINLSGYFAFNVPLIIENFQIWRLVTWMLIPSSGASIWGLLFMICLLMLGQNLEMSFGTFKMNMYFLSGILINIVGAILVYIITIPVFGGISVNLSLYYILFSMYLILGIFMPEAEVRLYFVLPIKMKWLIYLYALTLLYDIYSYFEFGYSSGGFLLGAYVAILGGSTIVFAMLNLFLFVKSFSFRPGRKQRKRSEEFKKAFEGPRPGSGITKHKCAICGRTENDDPTLVFRYCSKCAGNREYCQDHLFTHEHIHLS